MGGGQKFTHDLFDNGVGPHKFILSSGGNDDVVKVRDYMVQKMAVEAKLNVATMKMFPCMLFLNGEYWGAYYITESYDASFIQDHYGVAEGNTVMVKIKGELLEIEAGNEEDLVLYDEMIDYIGNHDMREEMFYQRACEMIDIDSFVDYYAMQIYIGNRDWPKNNVALWRAREEYPLNVWADGRWRYMLFDTNIPSVFGDPSLNDLERAIANDSVFASLIQNAEVEQKFRDRIRQLEEEIFCTKNREAAFNQWFDEMHESVRKSNDRFYYGKDLEEISQLLGSMLWFLEERPGYMEEFMQSGFENELF